MSSSLPNSSSSSGSLSASSQSSQLLSSSSFTTTSVAVAESVHSEGSTNLGSVIDVQHINFDEGGPTKFAYSDAMND